MVLYAAVRKRKPVLLIDDGNDSQAAALLFAEKNVEYVPYHISKFEESCCGELPTTRAPSVFAPDGVFKGLDGVRQYLSVEHNDNSESESAYW
ncbi:MAG: hypothetical protein DA330_10255 [Nitrososphaera sp.]|nr:hypothetical protein [Nitrososphaera sp.]